MEIRPIAGTSKGKGQNEAERKKLLDDLISSEKERAEHIMLVDLARNDIGIHAETGSVKVEKLLSVEEYSNVFHIVSIVSGKIPQNCNKMKLFEASFPAGTLTGAPKVRAMEIIQELEDYERGVYGGAFGFFDFNGNILSSIAIRTAIKIGENVYFQSSAGIVADSNPADEWNETQFKTNAIKSVIEGK
jgi:para-aminobenzoate synthetase